MEIRIFYSWQSDLPSKTNKTFLEKSILSAVESINSEQKALSVLDRDTKNEIGSPNIVDTVLYKINHCKFFICDISFINSNIPNPNVLIELGYAIKTLGWQKIICLFNTSTGKIEDLPFDINHNRVTPYNPSVKNEKERIAKIIKENIDSLFRNGQLYNPIEDHIKGKIDYEVLRIIRNMICILKFEENVSYSKFLNEISEKSIDDISYLLLTKPTLGFYYRYNYAECQNNLEQLLDKLLSCDYFSMTWREAVIRFIVWIDIWQHSMDEHFSPNLLKVVSEARYIIKEMHNENPANPLNSVLLLKHIEGSNYKVVQGGFIANKENVSNLVTVETQYTHNIASQIKELINIIDFWMNESGNEFILEPRHYMIDRFTPVVHEVKL